MLTQIAIIGDLRFKRTGRENASDSEHYLRSGAIKAIVPSLVRSKVDKRVLQL